MSVTPLRPWLLLLALIWPLLSAAQSLAVPLAPEYLPERQASGAPTRERPAPAEAVEASERDGGTVRVLLKAPRETTLSSEMEGRIIGLPLRLGDSFTEGDLLVRFDCENRLAELAMSEAEKLKAEKTFESKKALQHLDAVSSLDVELARADLSRAEAQMRRSRVRVNDCRIKAPYDGRVVKVHANPFEVVAPGAELMEIVETGRLELEALVPSAWMVWLEAGHEFVVHVDELDQDVPARVDALGSRVDPVSQSIAIRASIIEPIPGLLPGMSGDADFERPDG